MTGEKKMKRSIAIINYVAIFLLIVLFVVADCVAGHYADHITIFLCGQGIDYSSDEYQQSKAQAEDLAIEIAEEGAVLLKNNNEALPLSNPCLNVFGWGGCDNGYIYMGFGSGTASTYGQRSLYDGLREAGFELNETLVNAYNGKKFRRDSGWEAASWKLYEPLDVLSDANIKEAVEFSDTALVVISRFGMEGYDLPKYQNNSQGVNMNNGRTYLQLTPDEESMIKTVTDNFDNVIVLINSANAMELGFLDDDKIDAAIDVFFPGNVGSLGIGKLLTGEITPSGHLSDTFAYDHTTSAAYANIANGITDYTAVGGHYIDYTENIYTGYYWYETADADGFWDTDFAKNKWGIKNGYADVVQYPFGYGLSYADDFIWTVDEVSVPNGSALDADSEIELTLSVTNNSQYWSGKDVVQLYFSAPYVKGGIEKPSIKLGAFEKTVELAPGKTQSGIKLSVRLRDMASYDCYDKNDNGFIGYEAESGEYVLSLRTDAHTLKDGVPVFTFKLENGVRYEKSDVNETVVTNKFTTFENKKSGAESTYYEKSLSADNKAWSIDGGDSEQNIAYMTRENFVASFPTERVQRTVSKEFMDTSYLPNTPKKDENDVAPEWNSKNTNYKLNDMYILDASGKIIGLVDYNDKKWDDLVSQLDVETVAEFLADGGLATNAIPSIGKPACVDSDGPAGFNTTIFGSDQFGGYAAGYPCEVMIASTWNWRMAYRMGQSVGAEAEAAGIDGWYGPACNLHRAPYGGRNFEYYSEDPYLSGVMCKYAVIGAKEEGLYAYVKHFVANESEANRSGGYTWLTEQALRENYLKPFEIAVKQGKTLAIMSSYNRIGATRTSGSYNLLTEVLRNEWGFQGSVISDYNNGVPVLCPDEAIRAGNDLMMEASGSKSMFTDRTSATAQIRLHNGARNVLYTYCAAQYNMATSTGLDLDAMLGSRKTLDVFRWWIPLLVSVNVLVLLGAAFWSVMIFCSMTGKRLFKRKRVANEPTVESDDEKTE